MKPVLAYVEESLPATTLEERLELAEANGLDLEVAYRRGGDLSAHLGRDARIVTLQAFDMHDLHPLHPDPDRRRQAAAYVNETIDVASQHGIPRVLTACGFGAAACPDPFASCLAFYENVVEHARQRGVRILIELLSPLRAPAMTDPRELLRLIERLASPDTVGVALDLGHLEDAGREAGRFLQDWTGGVEELQLRGARSSPPPADFRLGATLRLLDAPPAVVCVEHREPIAREAFTRLVRHLREELFAAS